MSRAAQHTVLDAGHASSSMAARLCTRALMYICLPSGGHSCAFANRTCAHGRTQRSSRGRLRSLSSLLGREALLSRRGSPMAVATSTVGGSCLGWAASLPPRRARRWRPRRGSAPRRGWHTTRWALTPVMRAPARGGRGAGDVLHEPPHFCNGYAPCPTEEELIPLPSNSVLPNPVHQVCMCCGQPPSPTLPPQPTRTNAVDMPLPPIHRHAHVVPAFLGNQMLAKLISGLHKPDNQTILPPGQAYGFVGERVGYLVHAGLIAGHGEW